AGLAAKRTAAAKVARSTEKRRKRFVTGVTSKRRPGERPRNRRYAPEFVPPVASSFPVRSGARRRIRCRKEGRRRQQRITNREVVTVSTRVRSALGLLFLSCCLVAATAGWGPVALGQEAE